MWLLLAVVFAPDLVGAWFRLKMRHDPAFLMAGGVVLTAAVAVALKGERFGFAFFPVMTHHIRSLIIRIGEFHEGRLFTTVRFTFVFTLAAWTMYLMVSTYPVVFAQRTASERLAVLEKQLDHLEKSHDTLMLARIPERMAVVEKMLESAIIKQDETSKILWTLLIATLGFTGKELFGYIASRKNGKKET